MKDILAELMGEWCTGVNIGGMILKICLAIVLSAVIGSERATKRHAAGLRTFMLCLTGFMRFEYALKRRSDYFEIHLELNNKNSLQEFIAVIRKLGLKVDDIELNTAYMNTGLFVYSVSLSIDKKKVGQKVKHDDIISAISELEYVNYVEELGC